MGQDENIHADDLILIGLILKPHGLAGEVKVQPLTDFPSRFQNMKRAFLVTGEKRIQPLIIENTRFSGHTLILKFLGVDSKKEVEPLIGGEIAIPREECVPLPRDSYYRFDLIGMEVVLSHGDWIGTVIDVQSFPAQDILVVKTRQGQEVMVPFVKAVVPEVRVAERKIIVKAFSGLFNGE